MTTFPNANYLNDAARTETEMKAAFEAWLAATKQLPGGAAVATYTIATGTITLPTPWVTPFQVETEGAASTDDLTNITQTYVPDGALILFSTASSSHDVVVKHAAGGNGQIRTSDGADLAMLDNTMWLCLRRNGNLWDEVDRYYGAQKAAHRTFVGAAGLTDENAFTKRQLWAKGADIASAATLTPGTDGNFFHVTGTVTITAIASLQAGSRILLEFDSAALQITHNATSLILAAGRNYTTISGDVLEFVSEGGGNWRQAASAASSGSDVVTRSRFHEDFQAIIDAPSGWNTPWWVTLSSGLYQWVTISSTPLRADPNGVGRLSSSVSLDNSIIGPYVDRTTPTLACIVKAARNPTYTMRIANQGANGGVIRRCGACATQGMGGATNADGIYVRWVGTGNYWVVCRSGGVESTLDTAIAVSTAWHTFTLQITASLVTVQVDGATKGTINANIPSVEMPISAAIFGLTAGESFDLDFVDVETTR